MVIISKAVIKEFSKKHPDATIALTKWYNEVKAADWSNFSDLKMTFNTTDAVGNARYVFDIKGNHYRLVALIVFGTRTVFILFIGTHQQYDKIGNKNKLYKAEIMKHVITSKKIYHETMVAVYELMNKGEEELTGSELKKMKMMAKAAEEYEDNVLGLKPGKEPESIAAILEQKMYENKITQAKLAETLGLGKSKLSEILTGKRKPDVSFLKALYQKLNIDPAFLLDHV